jgi:hypothetical protein
MEPKPDYFEINRSLVKQAADSFNDAIKDFDQKMNSAVKAQEADYLKGYALFVRQKEQELHELVSKLNDRSTNSAVKDEIIFGLKT